MITVIAGLTRSGLTATCQMLSAGGLQVAGEYPAFEPFPMGQTPWSDLDGQVVKLVDSQLHLPPAGHYSVIRLSRDLDQQAKSFCKWLLAFGYNPNPSSTPRLTESFVRDYRVIDEWAKAQDKSLTLHFELLIRRPKIAAKRLSDFLGVNLDVNKAAAAIIKRSPNCYPTLLEADMLQREDSRCD